MIAYLEGKIIGRSENQLIVQTGGLGYRVFTTPQVASSSNDNVKLHTYLQVREDVLALFGFESKEDLDFFEMLISVSGVGPKMALQILSAGNTELIKNAIAAQDVAVFTKIGGVGKKTAEKIILELKGKVGLVGAVVGGAGSEDLLLALESLGYSSREIKDVLGKIDNALPLEEKMRQALKFLGK